MMMRFCNFLFVSMLSLIAFSCTLKTTVSSNDVITPGSDLVISEVFHISPQKFYTYSWIELFNPTNEKIRWYTEEPINDSMIVTKQLMVSFVAHFRIYNIDQRTGIGNPSYIIAENTGVGIFSNYHHEFAFQEGQLLLKGAYFSASDSVIFPGQFVVIVNSKDQFERHTNTGPFSPVVLEPKFPGLSIQNTTQPSFLVNIQNPFNPADPRLYWFTAPGFWDIEDASEVKLFRLIDTVNINTGQKVEHRQDIDVVRFGNYRPPDGSYPNNNPLGFVPENSSVARYGQYYATGNTADDFYISPDPIPGWYSQRRK